MGSQDLHSLFQQMGEVLSGLKALREAAEIRHVQSEQLQGLMRADVVMIKGDQRELEEKLECVICVMQHDLEALRTGAAQTTRSMSDLVAAIESLRRPIADITALRSKAAGLVFGFGVVGSAILGRPSRSIAGLSRNACSENDGCAIPETHLKEIQSCECWCLLTQESSVVTLPMPTGLSCYLMA